MSADPAVEAGGAALLIACALGIERFALRGADLGAAGAVTVLRTGMGPQSAERAVTRALTGRSGEPGGTGGPGEPGEPGGRRTALIATGFCAGLAPGMHPGDLVVADETRDPAGRTECTGTRILADALSHPLPGGPRRAVHIGPVVGSDHVVRGAERAALHSTGAIAVDMESAATLRTAVGHGVRPVAAVRVVVDAPEHELVRIGTLRGGISAFRVLRTVLPAFFHWHRSSLLPGGELDGHASPPDHPGRDVSL
ncbi:1-hydroxy-2-methyl-2-butenyl 4-diphosphate reductase [Streptomyces rapamycinicus]|uniref:1-hydroxy-2-methyl-2-butenyl 4-diphosphate reductase n=2 Tax=Streptomyces rapamycinicus TaxID=1226757 RepID=A0A0A0NCL7_STRRN|nr:1-hydroxy-2-methyl-2-butenyl 4-diphosphate reductase [Streptomyces rapamycinicus]AGP53833.1 1-hydroxy-2-methyl-2-butenyl 4-diphosphate reductase [Streptomyces rapamycinicus NRRL 5491]MBB4781323.1 uridine phosphorylase [Streptomyces rapamycinicus]RLV74033.1 1-hydroxy-2-methyl-2-butenyl 4-diphosphate reductase [Streptomyces rapamycinicus NRRL 5491]UTO61952.1 1-hydroxy-2-methyl-2-butenyl 4-diphosphate reductase [Streptomyces rapamycinicus]UTP29904.1 1-hydroxy-2-methyl-2-butenyl 4-diphosphate r